MIAQNLIDFDKEWSTLMAKKPEEFDSPAALGEFYVTTAEFPAGFMTQYEPSMITGEPTHQGLAEGYPIGKRFKSVRVRRVADTNPIHLGHHARADGRWRVYVFADADGSQLARWADWVATSPESPVVHHTPEGTDPDSVFDVKVIYQQDHAEVALEHVHALFLPRVGPFALIDYEKVYAADPEQDIFDLRDVDRSGAVVVVRPDQYVAHVLPLDATAELAAFFARNMLARDVAPLGT